MGNALDAKHARRFLAQCRYPPERMEYVMKTVNPDDNASIDFMTFVKARPARLPALALQAELPYPPRAHLSRVSMLPICVGRGTLRGGKGRTISQASVEQTC